MAPLLAWLARRGANGGDKFIDGKLAHVPWLCHGLEDGFHTGLSRTHECVSISHVAAIWGAVSRRLSVAALANEHQPFDIRGGWLALRNLWRASGQFARCGPAGQHAFASVMLACHGAGYYWHIFHRGLGFQQPQHRRSQVTTRVGYYWLAMIALLATSYISLKAYRRLNPPLAENSADAAVSDPGPLPLNQGPPLKEFVLTDQQGRAFNSHTLDGKVWVGSFFFTSCPSTCLKMNQVVAELAKDYASQDLHFVSISCDPEIDTPEVLAPYAAKFAADPAKWVFLTGPFEYTSKLGRELFLISVEKQSHSDRLVLLDKWGKVRGRYRATDPLEVRQLRLKIDRLLKEESPGQQEPEENSSKSEMLNEQQSH